MKSFTNIVVLIVFTFIYSCTIKQEKPLEMTNFYPWCIVGFDSLDRTPEERINMLKELGFTKYAYDWRLEDLNEMSYELSLAKENDIEIIAVWLWLNAKRDSLDKLSSSNERIFEILKNQQLSTTLWLSFNNNFFEGQTHEQSINRAIEMIEFIYKKAEEIDCNIALYNHQGWFGDHKNQLEIIEAMPQYSLKIVYNFHHAHDYLDEFPEILSKIKPYLSFVNLNGMKQESPKILPIGKGDYEPEMINLLMHEGFDGPWGILGHIESEDVKQVLERNMHGLDSFIGQSKCD
ncbi:MAG: TIM barrel protein [Paludibacter sp.]|nr:TIM barrel protein [Paludibacter sp.]